jgi:protocatechuate 3,4-dioxygenase beta subunit
VTLLGVALGGCGTDGADDAGDAPADTSPGASAAPSSTAATTDQLPTALRAADFEGLGTCVLLPEKTAGPFPLDEQFERRDVSEGVPGHPVRLGLRVVDETCSPVPGAAVEIWHCDATGDYSAFADGGGGKDAGPGTTFLRGTQTSDEAGIVEFLTIYPGWYRGRAVHVHLRVHLGGGVVLTSQLFFDEDYTAGVHADEPYAEFGPPDTSNAEDRIAGDPQREGTLLALRAADTAGGAGTLALVNLGIATS